MDCTFSAFADDINNHNMINRQNPIENPLYDWTAWQPWSSERMPRYQEKIDAIFKEQGHLASVLGSIIARNKGDGEVCCLSPGRIS